VKRDPVALVVQVERVPTYHRSPIPSSYRAPLSFEKGISLDSPNGFSRHAALDDTKHTQSEV
jgi:hypothetical protein